MCDQSFCEFDSSQGATTMDVDDEEDLVPEITKAHFEEAMKFARRFVLIRILASLWQFQCLSMASDNRTSSGLCPTTISRSTRCSRRPFSRAVDSATTSGLFNNFPMPGPRISNPEKV